MNNDVSPVGILEELIRFPTYQVATDKIAQGMKDCSSYLSAHLEHLGFSVKVDELFNVTAEREFGGEKSFLINTHFDTVLPAHEWEEALRPTLKGGKLYGLGSSDAKGGIAATLFALSRLEDCIFAKLIVQFMNYEDNSIVYHGSRWLGTPYFLSKNPGFTADYGVNVEPTVVGDRFALSVGCTGRLAFSVRTLGREAHSSTPHQGRNAIYDMMNVISVLRRIPSGKYRINGLELDMPINVATIEGGRAINIVPGECKITCERRLFPGEDSNQIEKTISSAIRKVKGVKTDCSFNRPVQLPYAIDRSEEIVSLVEKSVSDTLGYTPSLRIELGRTDSTYLYHEAGIKTVILGPGHTGHVKQEFIYIDRLFEFAKVLENLLGLKRKQRNL